MPFDQFTIEQIAGDMLPDATTTQKIATGFHRNAMTNEEGGVDPDESMYEVLVDRVNTTATVWLGTTLACAQCHNHKYDPFSQKDYFRLLAFFANSDYDSRTFGDGTRYFEGRLDLATPDQEKTRQQMQADIDRLEQELKTVDPGDARGPGAVGAIATRRRSHRGRRSRPCTRARRTASSLTTLEDGSLLASGPEPAAHVVHRRGRDATQGDHRPSSRGPPGSLAAEKRSGARRLRPLPRHGDSRRHRAGATPPEPGRRAARRPVQDDQSGRLRLPLRAGGLLSTESGIDEPQRRILGDQRHARR